MSELPKVGSPLWEIVSGFATALYDVQKAAYEAGHEVAREGGSNGNT